VTRHGAVPNAEWVLMYRGGLTRARIAALTRAPIATVGYHLAVAVAADPGLQAVHDQAAAKAPLRVSPQGLARMRELVAMVHETGRYPSRTAQEVGERTLASWLDRRRDDDAAGTLAPAFRDGLAVLPDWQRPPRAVADEARWQDRLKALAEYRAAGMTGPGTNPPWPEKNTTSESGCIPSAKRPAAVSSSRPRLVRWMMRCRAGARAGNAAGNPGTAPDSPTNSRQPPEGVAQRRGVDTLAVRSHVQKGHREWASDVSFNAKRRPRHPPSLHKHPRSSRPGHPHWSSRLCQRSRPRICVMPGQS
jgi:hypothetical protein